MTFRVNLLKQKSVHVTLLVEILRRHLIHYLYGTQIFPVACKTVPDFTPFVFPYSFCSTCSSFTVLQPQGPSLAQAHQTHFHRGALFLLFSLFPCLAEHVLFASASSSSLSLSSKASERFSFPIHSLDHCPVHFCHITNLSLKCSYFFHLFVFLSVYPQ